MKVLKSAAVVVLWITGISFASSTLSIPVPDMFPEEKKELLLTITIPSRLPEPEKEPRPSMDHSHYFDMDPFPAIHLSDEDWDMLRRLVRLNIATNMAESLIRNRSINSPYMLASVTHNILRNVAFYHRDYLLEQGTSREDIEFIESLMERQRARLSTWWSIDLDKYSARLEALKRELRANKGEVRVVRVVSDTDGSTVIHLNLREK